MTEPVKWAAQLEHVQEVSLVGSADLAYWTKRLRNVELTPVANDQGNAQIMIIAASGRFMGIAFRELSISVLLKGTDQHDSTNAAFLTRAFNSSRFFALCERVFFSTPYEHGDVQVVASFPGSLSMTSRNEGSFRAELRAGRAGELRHPVQVGDAGWEGPVYLPTKRPADTRSNRLFIARVKGVTRIYPFQPGVDVIDIDPTSDSEVLRSLQESHFIGTEWAIRDDAFHAKSKTYARPASSTAITTAES